MDNTTLIEQAQLLTGCPEGIAQLKACKSVSDWIDCYIERIDFCLAHNYPSNAFLKRYAKELGERGIYIDEDIALHNQSHLVFLGTSMPTLTFDSYSVSRIYVKHNSRVNIKARGNAFVMIDALDNSEIEVEIKGKSKVVVNLYAKALCRGATKIIQKYKETYDL